MSLLSYPLDDPRLKIIAFLGQHGCIARSRGIDALEVWEEDLSEHYLLRLNAQLFSIIDIVQVDGL
jgi:hypothetical protein